MQPFAHRAATHAQAVSGGEFRDNLVQRQVALGCNPFPQPRCPADPRRLPRCNAGSRHRRRSGWAIAKPVAGTVRVALGTVEQMSGWTLDATTGVVTFTTAPGNGVIVRAGFEFDVPVRFDTDMLDVTLDIERLGSITSIPLIEIRR